MKLNFFAVAFAFAGLCCSCALVNAASSNTDLFSQRFAWKDDKDKGNYYYNGYGNGGYGGGGYAGENYGAYGNNGYYGMSYNKDEWKLCEIAIPLALLLLVPLILVGAPFVVLGLMFYIGRSNGGGGAISGLDVVQSVSEAVEAFRALSTHEKCRMKVACELGYIFKGSKSKNRIIRLVDSVLPLSMGEYFEQLKEAAYYGEQEGKCERYVCPTNSKAAKADYFDGQHNKTLKQKK